MIREEIFFVVIAHALAQGHEEGCIFFPSPSHTIGGRSVWREAEFGHSERRWHGGGQPHDERVRIQKGSFRRGKSLVCAVASILGLTKLVPK